MGLLLRCENDDRLIGVELVKILLMKTWLLLLKYYNDIEIYFSYQEEAMNAEGRRRNGWINILIDVVLLYIWERLETIEKIPSLNMKFFKSWSKNIILSMYSMIGIRSSRCGEKHDSDVCRLHQVTFNICSSINHKARNSSIMMSSWWLPHRGSSHTSSHIPLLSLGIYSTPSEVIACHSNISIGSMGMWSGSILGISEIQDAIVSWP